MAGTGGAPGETGTGGTGDDPDANVGMMTPLTTPPGPQPGCACDAGGDAGDSSMGLVLVALALASTLLIGRSRASRRL